MIQLNSINDEIKDELTHFAEMSQKFSQETLHLENSSVQRLILYFIILNYFKLFLN